MDLRFQEVCRSYDIDIEAIEAAATWALGLAEQKAAQFNHDDCNGMVSDFDACAHVDPVEGPMIAASRQKFEEIATAFSGLQSAIAHQPAQRRGSDSLSGNTIL